MALTSYTKNLVVPVLTGSLLIYAGLLLSPWIFISILTLSGSKRNVPPLFLQQLWRLSGIHFAVFLTQLTSAQEVGASLTGAHSFTSLSLNCIVFQKVPSKLALSQKRRACCETLLPKTSSYCLKLLMKLSREKHTFQGIRRWDRSFRPTAWYPGRAMQLHWLSYKEMMLWTASTWSSVWPLPLMKLRSNVSAIWSVVFLLHWDMFFMFWPLSFYYSVFCISEVISLVTPILQKISNVSSLKVYAPPKSLIPFGDWLTCWS